MKKWYNVELEGYDIIRLKLYCDENKIQYETSGAGEYTHFEIYCNEKEAIKMNDFLNNDKGENE